jgi:type VI secretion system protein ImpA
LTLGTLGDIESSVAEVLKTVKKMTSGMDLEIDSEPEAVAAPVSAGTQSAPSPASGDVVNTREQAFRQIQQLADYFKKVEPHSPTAYLLEKAVRWGRYPFPRLMKELVRDEPALSELYRVMGIAASTVEEDEDDEL